MKLDQKKVFWFPEIGQIKNKQRRNKQTKQEPKKAKETNEKKRISPEN